MIKSDDIINIAKYFTIIAHTPGRLRVRVNPKIQSEGGDISLEDIESIPQKINGIQSIKIKKIIASVTITYDPNIFEPKLWEDLVENRNIEELTKLINNLAKEVV